MYDNSWTAKFSAKLHVSHFKVSCRQLAQAHFVVET